MTRKPSGEPDWGKAPGLPIKRDDVLRGLIHPSSWINSLAASICAYLPMSPGELEALLSRAQGHSIGYLIVLIQQKHCGVMGPMLLRRIESDSTGDVSAIYIAFRELGASPSPRLMSLALECLCSSDSNTVQSATDLLSHWVDQDVAVDETSVAKAVGIWMERDGSTCNSLLHTPLLSLKGKRLPSAVWTA